MRLGLVAVLIPFDSPLGKSCRGKVFHQKRVCCRRFDFALYHLYASSTASGELPRKVRDLPYSLHPERGPLCLLLRFLCAFVVALQPCGTQRRRNNMNHEMALDRVHGGGVPILVTAVIYSWVSGTLDLLRFCPFSTAILSASNSTPAQTRSSRLLVEADEARRAFCSPRDGDQSSVVSSHYYHPNHKDAVCLADS